MQTQLIYLRSVESREVRDLHQCEMIIRSRGTEKAQKHGVFVESPCLSLSICYTFPFSSVLLLESRIVGKGRAVAETP